MYSDHKCLVEMANEKSLKVMHLCMISEVEADQIPTAPEPGEFFTISVDNLVQAQIEVLEARFYVQEVADNEKIQMLENELDLLMKSKGEKTDLLEAELSLLRVANRDSRALALRFYLDYAKAVAAAADAADAADPAAADTAAAAAAAPMKKGTRKSSILMQKLKDPIEFTLNVNAQMGIRKIEVLHPSDMRTFLTEASSLPHLISEEQCHRSSLLLIAFAIFTELAAQPGQRICSMSESALRRMESTFPQLFGVTVDEVVADCNNAAYKTAFLLPGNRRIPAYPPILPCE